MIMDMVKMVKCVACLVNCGKFLCFAKKMITVITVMVMACSALKIFVIKDMKMKDITKKIKKVM